MINCLPFVSINQYSMWSRGGPEVSGLCHRGETFTGRVPNVTGAWSSDGRKQNAYSEVSRRELSNEPTPDALRPIFRKGGDDPPRFQIPIPFQIPPAPDIAPSIEGIKKWRANFNGHNRSETTWRGQQQPKIGVLR